MKILMLGFLVLGSFSSFADADCNLTVSNVEKLLLKDNTVNDESEFIKKSQDAVDVCDKQMSQEAYTVKAFILLGKKNCEDFGNQKSPLFLGHCYLRLAKTLDQYGY